jgi:flagellar hook assembly protein FlgD
LKGILDDVKANPKVFTPNNDNKNDFTVIEFTLAKVNTDITIKIFSPNGSLVTTILDDEYKDASDYRAMAGDIGGAREMPGYWDGTDEDGDLVPPGIYIYQVIADTDEGDVTEGGPVVVAY